MGGILTEEEREIRSKSEQEENANTDKTRREFIKLAGLGAGAVVAAKLLPDLVDGAGEGKAGVLGKPQPPPGTTNPFIHNVEVHVNPTASNPTNPFANYPTLQITTPNDAGYAKPALNISDGVNPTVSVASVDKSGNLAARAVQNVLYTPYFSTSLSDYLWLQKAIDALPAVGGVIFHPAVSLPCRSQVVIKPFVTIAGSGRKSSTIDFSGSTGRTDAALAIRPRDDLEASVVLKDFELKGNLNEMRYGIVNLPTPEYGRMSGWHTLFDNLWIHDFGKSLMMFDGTWSCWGNMTIRNSLVFNSKAGNCLQLKTINYIHKIYDSYFAGAGWDGSAIATNLYDVDIDNMWGGYSIHNNTFETAFGGLRLGYCFGGGLFGNHFEGLTAGLTVTNWCQGLDVAGNSFGWTRYPLNLGLDRLTDTATGAIDIDVHANFMDNVEWGPEEPMMAFTWAGNITGCRASSNVLQRFPVKNTDGTYHDFSRVQAGFGPSMVEDCQTAEERAPILYGDRVFKGKSSLSIRTKDTAGGPDDSSYGANPGTLVWNSAESRLYIRGPAGWKSVMLS